MVAADDEVYGRACEPPSPSTGIVCARDDPASPLPTRSASPRCRRPSPPTPTSACPAGGSAARTSARAGRPAPAASRLAGGKGHRCGRLHFHWPQVYYHDPRLGGAASWVQPWLLAGRLASSCRSRDTESRRRCTRSTRTSHPAAGFDLLAGPPPRGRQRCRDRPRPGDGVRGSSEAGPATPRPCGGASCLCGRLPGRADAIGRARRAWASPTTRSRTCASGTSAVPSRGSTCCSRRFCRRDRGRDRADRRRRTVDPRRSPWP